MWLGPWTARDRISPLYPACTVESKCAHQSGPPTGLTNLNPGQDTRAEPKLEGHRHEIEHSVE